MQRVYLTNCASITRDQTNVDVIHGVNNCIFKLVFFTPEMLLVNQKWQALLNTLLYCSRMQGLVVDEAHTIQKWY